MHARCAWVTFSVSCFSLKYSHIKKYMIYLLIKVCVNKGLICIKSIIKILKISYYNGKDKVCLRGGIGFEYSPMPVVNILIFYLFYYE